MLRHLVEGLSGLLPGQCVVCHAWPARPVCDACIARFAQPVARCPRCAARVPEEGRDCGQCMREPPPLEACYAAVTYAYPWSALITQFKFHAQPGWAHTLGSIMRSTPGVAAALDASEHVLPMPLAPGRLRERGFNQALLLAQRLAPDKVRPQLLLRTRHTPAQSALDREARRANVKGAFAVEPLRTGEVRGARVVLVDDVMTSGATVFSAAAVLRQAGAASVTAVVLARTDPPQ